MGNKAKQYCKLSKPYKWLKYGMSYYVADITSVSLYARHIYIAGSFDKTLVKCGIVFKTKEEAIECAKKMLKVAKQEAENE